MSRLRSVENVGGRTVEAARSFIGAPFRHHFKPDNHCSNGYEPTDRCWTSGLDEVEGFDCSGLVIASVCRALELSINTWPQQLRHIAQFNRVTHLEGRDPRSGDIIITTNRSNPSNTTWHMGIYTEDGAMVHASGLPSELRVVEGPIGDLHTISVVNFKVSHK